ncbi:hypothetical protein D9M71_771040 [compost metagenome]
MLLKHVFQLLAACMLRPAAPILALPFQQVVGLQHDRRVAQQLLAQVLATQALLQHGKGLYSQFSR